MRIHPAINVLKTGMVLQPSRESGIICEGFCLSESQYGMRYLFVVGDGDSSVMANLHSSVLYGIFVQIIECTNHACKAYRSRLEQLVKDRPQYLGRGGLTKSIIQHLTVGARIAIPYHSKDKNVAQLREDLRNGPSHVLGDHHKCGAYFCNQLSNARDTDDDTEMISLSLENNESNATIVDTLEAIIVSEIQDSVITEEMEVDA
uniref:Mutator-like transposase domain-containing protein n=1 Tax=Amphimedon queenslandica TaxID=400682 RepID=A0A1X7VJA9_AMPQE